MDKNAKQRIGTLIFQMSRRWEYGTMSRFTKGELEDMIVYLEHLRDNATSIGSRHINIESEADGQ